MKKGLTFTKSTKCHKLWQDKEYQMCRLKEILNTDDKDLTPYELMIKNRWKNDN